MGAGAAQLVAGEAQGLWLEAGRVVEGLYAGGHLSPWRGSGDEFHDYRPYLPGDDPQQIDWKLWGRTDRRYVKRHRQRGDLEVMLVVDASASMGFAGLPGGRSTVMRLSKLGLAQRLAATVAWLAVRQGDRVGLAVVDRRVHAHLPVGGAWVHLQRLVATLDTAKPGVGPSDIGQGLRHSHALARRRGLVVVLSDLLDDREAVLSSLARFHHDGFAVAVLQVLTPDELDLRGRPGRRWHLVDLETRRGVSTAVDEIGDRYRQLMLAHIAALHAGCSGLGIYHAVARTDEPVPAVLRRWLGRNRATHHAAHR